MSCDLKTLIAALQTNNATGVRACLDQGYPHGQTVEMSTNTPLHHAAQSQDPQFIDWFIAAGAEPNARNSMGQTALHTAAMKDSLPNCVALARNGADVLIKDKYGYTARDLAFEFKSFNCVAVLDSLIASRHIESMMSNDEGLFFQRILTANRL